MKALLVKNWNKMLKGLNHVVSRFVHAHSQKAVEICQCSGMLPVVACWWCALPRVLQDT